MAGVTTTAAIATGALSVATKALLGPIGLIATALGVATLAWHNYGEEAKNATDKTAQSIESAKGKVEQLKKQLEDLSNVNPLQDELNQAAKNYADTIASSIEVININGDAVKTNTEQVRKAKKQLEEIVDLYHQAQSIIDERTNKLKDETKATDDVVVSLKSLEEAEKSISTSIRK
jgi:ABC-type transporter Mla subunit MlaD